MKKYVVRGMNRDEILKKIANHFNVDISRIKYEILKEKENEVELKVWIEELEKTTHSDIKIQKEGIFLKVLPTKEEAHLLKKYLIIDLEKKEVKDYDLKALEKAIASQGSFIKVAEFDSSYYIDGQFIIEVLNSLEAVIQLIPPKRGNMPTLSDIKEGCKAKQITFGIREKAVKTMLENKIFNTKVVLAKAKPAINGENGKLIYHFDRSKKIKVSENENVDFKNLNWVKNIKKDEPLVERTLAKEGKTGINIFGKIIPVKAVKEAKLPKGKNTYISKDGLYLKSEIDGQIIEEGENKVSVVPVLTISSDVDYSTGNIDFVGTVVVQKNVLTGFSVKASEDIIIEGLVEDALIEAKRDVVIKKGVVASEEGDGLIIAGHDVRAKFIQNMKVKAREKIIVEDYILLGEIEAGGNIECISGKGRIIGGNVKSQTSITANVIGGRYETHTNLEIGVLSDISEREKEFDKKIFEIETKREKAETSLKKFMQKSESVRSALKTKEKELREIIKLLKEQQEALVKEKEKITEEYSGIVKGKIQVLKELNPGVIVKMGKHIFVNKQSRLHSIFTLDEENGKIICT